jgi:hypothetical protein
MAKALACDADPEGVPALPVRPSHALACDADPEGVPALPVRPSHALACDVDKGGRGGFAGAAVQDTVRDALRTRPSTRDGL